MGLPVKGSRTAEPCSKVISNDPPAPAGIMLDGYPRLSTGARRWRDLNHEPGVLNVRCHVDIVHPDLADPRDPTHASNQHRHPVSKPHEAPVHCFTSRDVSLVSNPVRASGSGDGTPGACTLVPDETFLGLDVLVDAPACVDDALIALGAIPVRSATENALPARVVNARRHGFLSFFSGELIQLLLDCLLGFKFPDIPVERLRFQ